ncbi:glycoside hydrolase family 43 protein [Paractinoplanes hotanensis]|uniref:Glycoside hydrolase family 43 protein n=1 Tax=Paractinoplanes hotanensis TaxID=2906497 RepID=A0ABT0XUF7_9ACTN|nr:glycoside hydrolase family 43 protein [Actinoplanes hotanensis]MCM4077367.1 glycoside hydrolase family 43 protein [Actinoplanes hotanensis]
MSFHLRRRTLLGAAAGTGLAGLGLASSSPATAAQPRSDAEIYGVPTVQPLVTQRADPFITPRTDGRYYFTGSVPEYDRIALRGASTLAGLSGAAESVIWRRPASGKMAGHVWAPELHRVDGRWYVYFAAGDSDDVFRIRTYVLESPLADPLDASGWQLKAQLMTEWDGFTLDATTFAHRGRRYLVWAQSEPEIAVNTSLYIARMGTPWSLASKPTRITTPTRDWEIQGFRVNEGPAVLIRNGRVFLTFSASATDARYCMGLLTADADADLLRRESWVKTPDPIFVTNASTERFGPGHNSFTVAEDGRTDVLVYHARDYRDITGDPLYDPNRHARVQRLYWHPDGTPLFGVPVGDGGPIVRITPADRPDDYVRHSAGGTIVVQRAPRDLAATQFRFEAQADGTEVLRSVDQPAQFIGPGLRLGTTPLAVRREVVRAGFKLRVEGGYLRIAGSTVSVGSAGTVLRLS